LGRTFAFVFLLRLLLLLPAAAAAAAAAVAAAAAAAAAAANSFRALCTHARAHAQTLNTTFLPQAIDCLLASLRRSFWTRRFGRRCRRSTCCSFRRVRCSSSLLPPPSSKPNPRNNAAQRCQWREGHSRENHGPPPTNCCVFAALRIGGFVCVRCDTDAVLCRPGIDQYLSYDYVGAPWHVPRPRFLSHNTTELRCCCCAWCALLWPVAASVV
jgi:hypothetical protein